MLLGVLLKLCDKSPDRAAMQSAKRQAGTVLQKCSGAEMHTALAVEMSHMTFT